MVTRVPTRNHQVQSFWTAPIPTMAMSARKTIPWVSPKNLYHFLVVGKGGNEQHYEQDQIRQGDPSHNH